MSSIASAFGSCQLSSSASEWWMRSSRFSIGRSAGVSTTPPSRATMWLPSTRTMPKPRFAAPGSIPITTCMETDSGPGLGCLLGGDFGHDLLGDVEVGVDLADVVVVFEGVEQAEQGAGVALADLDHALRLHRHLGGPDLHPGGLESLAHGAQVGGLA